MKERWLPLVVGVAVLILVWLTTRGVKRGVMTTVPKDPRTALMEMLQHVSDNTEAYRGFGTDLSKYPIVTKADIKKTLKSRMCDGGYENRMKFSTKSSVNTWSEKQEETAGMSTWDGIRMIATMLTQPKSSYAMITGGSSGEYFYQWFSASDSLRGARTYARGIHEAGLPPSATLMVVYLHGSNTVKMIEKFSPILPEISCYVPDLDPETADLTDASYRRLLYRLNSERPDVLVMFPNMFFRFVQKIHVFGGEVKHQPKYIDLSADFLFSFQYDFLKRYYPDSDIRMTYGCIEFGQIAQQIPRSQWKSPRDMFTYKVYGDCAHVENHPDGSLVVTSLLYKTLPLIRYNISDKARVSIGPDGAQYLHDLVGKNKQDIDVVRTNMEIDRMNRDWNLSVINFRYSPDAKTGFVTVLDPDNFTEAVAVRFCRMLDLNGVEVDLCRRFCKTRDRFDGKNSPVLKEVTAYKA